MNKLNETIKKRKPVKVYIEGEYFGIMEYNQEKNRYENNYGNIPIEKIPLILAGNESVNHIKLEVIE